MINDLGLQKFPNEKAHLLQVWDDSEVEQGMSSDISIVRFFCCEYMFCFGKIPIEGGEWFG